MMKSVIDDIFFGRYRSSYTCKECEKRTVIFQKFNVVYLPIVLSNGTYSKHFLHSLDQLEKDEQLKGENGWPCPNSSSSHPSSPITSHTHKMEIFKPNKVVIFCLKRFQKGVKISSKVDFPFQIEEGRLNKSNSSGKGIYRLYGVVNHFGSLSGGHYTAYCRDKNE